jgi:hypothetical protein
MQGMRALLFGAGLGLLGVIAGPWALAEGQQTAPSGPTFRISSNLVFLDVTVVDKKGHPVVTGLTKDGAEQHVTGYDPRLYAQQELS